MTQNPQWSAPAPRPDQYLNFDDTVELFHVALDRYAEGHSWIQSCHGREGDYVDCSAESVVEALLDAGWQPPGGADFIENETAGLREESPVSDAMTIGASRETADVQVSLDNGATWTEIDHG